VARSTLAQALRELPEGIAQRVRTGCAPGVLAAIDVGGGLSWVSLQHHLDVLRTIRRVVGDARFRELARQGSARTLDESAFRPLVESAFRMLGVTPRGLLRMASQGYNLSFRLCGSLLCNEVSPTSCRVLLLGLPLEGQDAETFCLGLAGTFESLVEMAKERGRVSINAAESSPGRVVFDVAW
jgi:hypothetical protein